MRTCTPFSLPAIVEQPLYPWPRNLFKFRPYLLHWSIIVSAIVSASISFKGVKPRNSSRISRFFLSKNLTPIANCSVPEISAVSSANIEKPTELFAKATIWLLTVSSHSLISSFWILGDVYLALPLAFSICSFKIASPASILKSNKSFRLPDLESLPLNAMSCVPQKIILDKIGSNFARLLETVALKALSNKLSTRRSGCSTVLRNLVASSWDWRCQALLTCFWAQLWKSLYFMQGELMNAPVKPRWTGWGKNTYFAHWPS